MNKTSGLFIFPPVLQSAEGATYNRLILVRAQAGGPNIFVEVNVMKEYLYTNKDGRIRMVIQKDDGTITSKSYPRVLMEQKLGRELESYEEVHHIDGNRANNDILNLEVINRTDHRKLHGTKYYDAIARCEVCGKEFIWTASAQSRYYNDLSRKSVPKNRSITCSKHCAGVLSHKTYLKNAGVPEWNREQT